MVDISEYPIVDLIACFKIENNQLKHESGIDKFRIQINGWIDIYKADSEIASKKCDFDDLKQIFQNIDIKELKRYTPLRIYVIGKSSSTS
jgi:hypothetical protein